MHVQIYEKMLISNQDMQVKSMTKYSFTFIKLKIKNSEYTKYSRGWGTIENLHFYQVSWYNCPGQFALPFICINPMSTTFFQDTWPQTKTCGAADLYKIIFIEQHL